MTSQDRAASGVTPDDLARVSRTKVFFGHQSVGMNVLDGVPGVYAAHGVAAPAIVEDGTEPGQDGGFVDHAFIGENAKPLVKIQDFDAKMRSGARPAGRRGDDEVLLRRHHRPARTSPRCSLLPRDHRRPGAGLPQVTFVHVTVPLMTEQGQLSKLKSLLTGRSGNGPADNVARERLNA